MRVLFIVNALGEGGTEKSLADLLPGLRDAGVESRILMLRSRGDEGVEQPLRRAGFDIGTIAATSAVGRIRAIRRVIRSFDPDIVHTMLFEAGLLGRLAAVRTGSTTLVSLVNQTYGAERRADPRLRPWKLRVVQGVDLILAHLVTDHFHAVSDAVRSDAVSGLLLPDDKVSVIRRGRRVESLPVATSERRDRARMSLSLEYDAHVLVAVGRQEYAKGHRYLVEAMERLVDVPNLVLLVVGREGNETTVLQRLMEVAGPTVSARIRFLGHRPDVAAVLAAGDVFVFPSLFEGMPGALIEAMAIGLPTVASDIDPIREVTEGVECGLLVPTRDADGLAAAIRRLLDDPEAARQMGGAGRQAFEERYTIDASVAAFLDLYRDLVTTR